MWQLSNDDIYNGTWQLSNDDIYNGTWQLSSDDIYNDDICSIWILNLLSYLF